MQQSLCVRVSDRAHNVIGQGYRTPHANPAAPNILFSMIGYIQPPRLEPSWRSEHRGYPVLTITSQTSDHKPHSQRPPSTKVVRGYGYAWYKYQTHSDTGANTLRKEILVVMMRLGE